MVTLKELEPELTAEEKRESEAAETEGLFLTKIVRRRSRSS